MKTAKFACLRFVMVGALCAVVSPRLFASVIFADNFDNGDVSDWSKTTNYAGPSFVTVRTDSFVSAPDALYTYLTAPAGGINLVVDASHAFTAPTMGDYVLSLAARSSPCSGCTISYDVIVDGSLLDREFSPTSFEARTYALSALAAGLHTLTLGVFTTNASSGTFSASFDDVSIASVPEPTTFSVLIGGIGVLGIAARRRLTVGQPPRSSGS